VSERWVCLDLFSGLGGFSAAFADSEAWEVVTVDIEEQFGPDHQADVYDLRPSDFGREFDVVLAGPPCTYLSVAGNHDAWDFDTHEPLTDEARDAVALLFHTVGLIRGLSPEYWILENPRGRARWFLGEPEATVTYCQYGENYQKPTDLWGEHPPGLTYRSCSAGDRCHERTPRDDDDSGVLSNQQRDPAERAKVPYALSAAVRDACERALAGELAKQVELGEIAGGGGSA